MERDSRSNLKLPRRDSSVIFTEHAGLRRRARRAIQNPSGRERHNDGSREPLLRSVRGCLAVACRLPRERGALPGNGGGRGSGLSEQRAAVPNRRLQQPEERRRVREVSNVEARAASRAYPNLFLSSPLARFSYPINRIEANSHRHSRRLPDIFCPLEKCCKNPAAACPSFINISLYLAFFSTSFSLHRLVVRKTHDRVRSRNNSTAIKSVSSASRGEKISDPSVSRLVSGINVSRLVFRIVRNTFLFFLTKISQRVIEK